MIARRLMVGALLLGAAAAGHAEPADLLLYNGKVLTIDDRFSIQTTLAVRDGRILAVGGEDLREKFQAPLSIDLKGRVLLPRVHRYAHPRAVEGEAGHRCREGALHRRRAEDVAREGAQELGPGRVDHRASDGTRPCSPRSATSSAATSTPYAEESGGAHARGGHSSVGNSLALKIAKVDKKTPDPANGLIERDSAGEPNGIIRERNDLYSRNVPQEKWEDLRDGYVKTLQSLFALGITSIIEATGSIDDEPVGQGGVKNPRPGLTLRRLQELGKDHDLPRTTLYISYPGAERLRAYPHHTGYGDEKVRIGPIGESAVDGGFTGPTAWTLVDYKGLPGFRGKGRFTDEQLQEMVDSSAKLGWQMGLHAIGDAAIVQTVDAYSKSIRAIVGQQKDHRWFLDHFTVMPPAETMQKMAADGIRIAQQPNFLYNLEGRYQSTLDDWRLRHNNSVGTPAKQYGLFVAFGSDNLPIGPMVGLYAAVTRRGPSGTVHGPEEAVTMSEALRMYTANGPFLSFRGEDQRHARARQAGRHDRARRRSAHDGCGTAAARRTWISPFWVARSSTTARAPPSRAEDRSLRCFACVRCCRHWRLALPPNPRPGARAPTWCSSMARYSRSTRPSPYKAVAVKDGRILAVGGDDIAQKYQAPVRIDLKGRTLMPGFDGQSPASRHALAALGRSERCEVDRRDPGAGARQGTAARPWRVGYGLWLGRNESRREAQCGSCGPRRRRARQSGGAIAGGRAQHRR